MRGSRSALLEPYNSLGFDHELLDADVHQLHAIINALAYIDVEIPPFVGFRLCSDCG